MVLLRNNEPSYTLNHFKNWIQERRYVKDLRMNWFPKIRDLSSIENFIEHCKLIFNFQAENNSAARNATFKL